MNANGGLQSRKFWHALALSLALVAPLIASAHEGPRIKGLALGDPPVTVRNAATALTRNGSSCHIDEKKDTSNPYLNLTIHTAYGMALNCGAVGQPQYVAFFEFRDNQMTRYTVGAEFANAIFNAGGMPLADFAKAFVNAYGIPRLAPSSDQRFLTYRDADGGWEVDLYPDHSFTVRTVDTPRQQTKNFN
ncbi:hypothetical protein [Paraburkholderia solisilvae]|uniref:Lipoprotein n=1 Tax=Paraburkholderia solisilvae TaxID=624376 RepID=A0A6J5ESG9_9BURK|nr:hypothetical protein [Paraburkholderia solisilvae]CAB3768607.1 hypothetical protein LMG29739_05344 [Paraburkholderia solisilvae]